MLERLADLLEYILRVLPRLEFIEPNCHGLRVTLGKNVQDLEAGWYIYWPVIQAMHHMIVVRQTCNLPTQFCHTKDGQSINISALVVYKVKDVVKAYFDVHEIDEAIQDVASCGILHAVKQFTFAELLEKIDELKDTMSQEVKTQTRGWGLDIMKVDVLSIVPIKVYGIVNMGEVMQSPIPLEEED